MLITCASCVGVARNRPGRSCASQNASSRVSTRVCMLRPCKARLAAWRWHGVMQFQVRVHSTCSHPFVAAAAALSCSVIIAEDIASSAKLVLFCRANQSRCVSVDSLWPGGMSTPRPSGSVVLRDVGAEPGAGSVGLAALADDAGAGAGGALPSGAGRLGAGGIGACGAASEAAALSIRRNAVGLSGIGRSWVRPRLLPPAVSAAADEGP